MSIISRIQSEVRETGNALVISSVWIVGFICWRIMKKIQPEESKLYLVYAISICVLVTWFSIAYSVQI